MLLRASRRTQPTRFCLSEASPICATTPARKVRLTMMATGRIASTALIAISAILLLTQIGVAQRPPEQTLPTLIVTPSTSIAFSGPQGGPFSPSLIEYRISASTGTVSYSIKTPSWLTASSTSGVTDTSGATITFRVNASASTLRPGIHGPGIVFTSGRGSAIRFARLIVRGPSPAGPADQVERGRGGYLLDGRGGYLLDDRGNRLLAQ
jgi:hypothetical protein